MTGETITARVLRRCSGVGVAILLALSLVPDVLFAANITVVLYQQETDDSGNTRMVPRTIRNRQEAQAYIRQWPGFAESNALALIYPASPTSFTRHLDEVTGMTGRNITVNLVDDMGGGVPASGVASLTSAGAPALESDNTMWPQSSGSNQVWIGSQYLTDHPGPGNREILVHEVAHHQNSTPFNVAHYGPDQIHKLNEVLLSRNEAWSEGFSDYHGSRESPAFFNELRSNLVDLHRETTRGRYERIASPTFEDYMRHRQRRPIADQLSEHVHHQQPGPGGRRGRDPHGHDQRCGLARRRDRPAGQLRGRHGLRQHAATDRRPREDPELPLRHGPGTRHRGPGVPRGLRPRRVP
ncbi:MAG: hypothetical protein HY815_29640 [Candidatus Riflebacteria bacterium]|nr:hypothetical protein [Candidatus Riflebacteria bacterium]